MFDVKTTTEECIRWITEWFEKQGKNSPAVIGISGGKDSSVVAALCVKALGNDRVIGVFLPNGYQSDIYDSYDLADFLGIKTREINILRETADIYKSLGYLNEKDISWDILMGRIPPQIRTNVPARIRMTVLYAVASQVNGRVANTSNKSEKYIGYSTKWGDSCGDFSPLGNILATEVVEMGKYLGLPEHLVVKAPSDGMCGKTDEDNLGFTYAELDKYIKGENIPKESLEKIMKMHNNPNTAKKEYGIDSFQPS